MTNSAFIGQRVLDVFRFLPKRLRRLFYHFWLKRYGHRLANQISHPGHITMLWIIELGILIIEIFGIGESYDILTTIFKRSTRSLSPRQLEIATGFYGDAPILRKVRIDEQAKIGMGKMATAYVSCFTINTGAPIEDDVLIHELVHIIQYKKYGMRYMTRALYGQNWGGGYNYGGTEGLKNWQQADKELYFFNPEQEAEFITDLFLLSQKRPTGWFGRNLPQSIQTSLTPRKILGSEHFV
ncbi:MAG TPA: hypothetical protein ENK85_02630 [Saprospiraceae bacterium]|nr:hypothetical protein [Saprospiraceae bacterium]